MTVVAAEAPTVEVVEATKNYVLNAKHRCDGCGAQAYVMVTLRSGAGDLYFCRHHAHKHESALLLVAETWYSEESKLKENKKQGSEN
jgi:hypothetical protein